MIKMGYSPPKKKVFICRRLFPYKPKPFLVKERKIVYDDDYFYYHSWRKNVAIAFGNLSSFVT